MSSRRSSRRSAIQSYAEASDKDIENGVGEVDEDAGGKSTPKKRGVKKEVGATVNGSSGGRLGDKSKATPTKKKGGAETVNKPATKRKVKDEDEDADEEKVVEKPEKKVVKKRKTKEETDTMPIATRTAVATLKKKMYIGAHISSAGGVQNSIPNALHIGANAFALFLKSQRKWSSPPLAADAKSQFHALTAEHSYDASKHVLPHGSYLVNLAQADKEKAEQAYTCFVDDLARCEALGIKLYNFHPGSTGGNPREEALARIAGMLNRAHKATKSVVTVLENMAGAGNVVGCAFEDLRDIIKLVEDKKRVGVCIDTCHAFAAGYDLRSKEAFAETMKKFDDVVGNEYLCALHLNDSKTPLGSKRDLHANIGTGFLGLRAFWNVVNYGPFEGLPMVLETPIDRIGEGGKKVEDKGVWATEIKLLEGLVGVDFEEEKWRAEEERLQEEGKGEREKFGKQVEKKAQKTLDGMFKKGKKKGKKGVESDDESEGGCSH